jgi:peptide/nickel transport system substrate-binding protein
MPIKPANQTNIKVFQGGHLKMTMYQRSLILVFSLVLLFTGMTGVFAAGQKEKAAEPEPVAAQTEPDKTVILARSGQVNTIDPLRADYAQTNYIVSALYDPLVAYDHDGKMIPSLATEYKLSDDVRSVDLTLRSDAVFHDGTPVTAEDVAYTLDRLKRLGAGIAAQIEGYQSTEIKDDTHLTIRLDGPNSLFLSALSKVYVLNSALVAANAGSDDGQAWLQSHDAGSGPFEFDAYQNNAYIVRLFDGYWDKAEGRPSTIVFRRIDEASTATAELRAGNVHLYVGLTGRDADEVAKAPNVSVSYLPTPIQADVALNAITGPTADPRVRKAISLAYDYEGGMEGIRYGHAQLANGPIPSTFSCRPALPTARRDLAEAKRLLAEAGVSDLKLVMRFQPVFEAQKREATLFQSNLREIGVTLELEPIAFPDYLASLKNPDTIPQAVLFTDYAIFPETGVILVKSFHSKAVGSTNKTGYSNPEVDKLLDEVLVTADESRRCELYEQIQTIVDEACVYVDMYTLQRPIVYRDDRVTNIVNSPQVFPVAPADLRLVTK